MLENHLVSVSSGLGEFEGGLSSPGLDNDAFMGYTNVSDIISSKWLPGASVIQSIVASAELSELS